MTILLTTAIRSRPRCVHAIPSSPDVTTERSAQRPRTSRSINNWMCSGVGCGMRYERQSIRSLNSPKSQEAKPL